MGAILGLDYGTRRIGIAVSDPTATIARAVGCHHEGVDGSVLKHLEELIAEHAVVAVVVGLPLTAEGGEGEIALQARRFADRVAEISGLPVHLTDERYSSQEADRWLRASGRRRRPKGERDAVAAELILQQYLDTLAVRGRDDRSDS